MSIRGLMSVGLPPLFLVMGVAMALTADLSVRRELARAVTDSGGAAARSVAEFVAARQEEGRTFEEPLRRVLGFGQILELCIHAPDGFIPITRSADGNPQRLGNDPLPQEVAARLERRETWVGPVEWYPEGPVVRAFTGLRTGGSVGAVVDVADLVSHAERMRPRFARATAFFTLAGVVVALLLSSWLAGGIGALEARARDVAAGGPSHDGDRGPRVRELFDLVLTFRTMRGILDDSVAQGRRALLARAVPKGLRASVLRGAPAPSLDVVVAGRRVTAHPVGHDHPGLFAGVVAGRHGGRAFAGVAEGADAADRALEAAAAQLYLESRLPAGRDPLAIIQDAEAHFHLARIAWTSWSGGDGEARRLHTLPPRAARSLDAVETLCAGLDQAAVGAAAAGALPDLGPGVLMLIRPAGDAPAPSTEAT